MSLKCIVFLYVIKYIIVNDCFVICVGSSLLSKTVDVTGKKLKSYATLPRYLSFLLGKGGKLLHLNSSKSFKTSQSVLSDHKSLQHTCLDPQCICDTLQNCPFLQKLHVYSPQILHLSSNRREQNSALPFQFTTPGRELTQKSMKPMNF